MDFLRYKQSGVQHDFTGTLADAPDVFALDEVAKFGLPSTVSALAYDPVQSLLAVGTHEGPTRTGEIHIFGQGRVHVTFPLPRKASVKLVQLRDSKVVVLDTRNNVTIFDLEAPAERPVEYYPPGVVTAMHTDPCLDFALLGLQNGEVVAYDIDREIPAPLKVPNFWRPRSPKARLLPVVSLALHPKDVGTLLIGYLEGAAVYSFKQNAVLRYLQFELPPGAPGADTEPANIRTLRRPRLSQAVWHPTGTFIATTYEDSVMVFWNPRDGSIVQARTLQDAHVHRPGGNAAQSPFGDSTGISIRQSIFKIAWCSGANPDDTSLLIAGGNSMTMPAKGMTLIDLGPSPNTLTSSVQVVSEHFASPRRQRILPTPTDMDVVDFCLIPKTSPHYGGGHDPMAVVALLASGELATLRFPDGHPLSPASLLNPSLVLAHPFATRVDVSAVNRMRWLSMMEKNNKPKDMIVGGLEHIKPHRRYENRTIVQSSHPDGTVRIWDVGHADEVENKGIIELDAGRVLQRGVDLAVECVSMAGSTGETAVGMETGEVVMFRWGHNKAFGRTPEDEELTAGSSSGAPEEGLRSAVLRADPDIKESLLPVCVLDQKCGSVVALKMSDVGFCAVAYQTGHLCVVDMRVPAVIYHQSLTTLSKEGKRSSFRKPKDQSAVDEKATCIEFGVLTLEGDEFSSIALFVGTSVGRVLTFKLLPQKGGNFGCTPAGVTHVDDSPVISITPLNSDSGHRSWATPQATASLRDGIKTPGVLVAVTKLSVRIFKPPGAKGAHKTWDDELVCLSAAVCELEGYGVCLTCMMDNGSANNYSIPGLKQIASLKITNDFFDKSRLNDSRVLENGYILSWTGEHEFGLGYQWGGGTSLGTAIDTLYNPSTPPPARPTISNLQWLAGIQYISIPDLDVLIAGPDRPLSKKMKEQLRLEQQQDREQARLEQQGGGSGSGGGQDEGVFANMARNMRERTEKLSFTTDSMDKLGETSASFADDVSKYVGQQKRKAMFGAVTGGKWFG